MSRRADTGWHLQVAAVMFWVASMRVSMIY